MSHQSYNSNYKTKPIPICASFTFFRNLTLQKCLEIQTKETSSQCLDRQMDDLYMLNGNSLHLIRYIFYPMIRTILRWLFLLAFCIVAGLFITFSPTHHSQVNYKDRTIRLTRDQFGIATIHASSMEDYLYGIGTLFAEDRLFQMTMRGYVIQGRMCEFLGEKALDFDRFMRELNLKKWAERRAARFKAENISEYNVFMAFINGINDRVAKMRVLPMEFYITGMKWENYTMNHFYYYAIQFDWGNSWNANDEATRSALLAHYTKEEIQQILPNKKQTYVFKPLPMVTEDEIPERLKTPNIQARLDQVKFNPLSVQRVAGLNIIQFFAHIDGSNGWIVGGQHTQSGFPIVVNDPHQETSIPSQLYQFKLNYTYPNGTSGLSVGGTNPGSPHLYGTTPYFSLACTTAHTDSQDFYREKVEGDKYLLNGKWRDLTIRNETILVKTPNGIRQDIYTIRQTHRGPIIRKFISSYGSYEFQNDSISLTWTGYNDEWESQVRFTYIIFSQNIDELRDFLQNATKTYYPLNIMVGTIDNHIVTQQSGLHPIRRVFQSGTYIKDGTTTEHDWVGLVPHTDRIHIYDPPKGYFVHANNKVAENSYYGGILNFTTYSARADRIDELIRTEITAGRKINIDFAKKVLLDTVDIYCQQIIPEIIEVIPQAGKVLSGFDCDFTATSYQASAYEVFFYKLYNLMKPIHPGKMSVSSFYQMGQGMFRYMRAAYHGDEAKREVMREAWQQSLFFLADYFKTDDMTQWQWGLLHVDHAKHAPFRNHPTLSKIFDLRAPGVGNFYTICMTRMEQLQFGNFEMSVHPVYRSVVDLDPNVEDWFVIDTGVSENILSSHYSDQWELYRRSQMLPFRMRTAKQASQL